jgi:hypothetical protein
MDFAHSRPARRRAAFRLGGALMAALTRDAALRLCAAGSHCWCFNLENQITVHGESQVQQRCQTCHAARYVPLACLFEMLERDAAPAVPS